MRTLIITLVLIFAAHSMLDNFIQDSNVVKTIKAHNAKLEIALAGGVR